MHRRAWIKKKEAKIKTTTHDTRNDEVIGSIREHAPDKKYSIRVKISIQISSLIREKKETMLSDILPRYSYVYSPRRRDAHTFVSRKWRQVGLC